MKEDHMIDFKIVAQQMRGQLNSEGLSSKRAIMNPHK